MNSKKSSKSRLIKIPIQAYLEPIQAHALRSLSARTGIPQQAYIREAIDAVLAKYRVPTS